MTLLSLGFPLPPGPGVPPPAAAPAPLFWEGGEPAEEEGDLSNATTGSESDGAGDALSPGTPGAPRRGSSHKAPMPHPQIPRAPHPKAAQGLCSSRGPTATEPLTSRRGARGQARTGGRAVWPDRSPVARQRYCGARLLMEHGPVFLNFGLGGKFPPITPQAFKPL